jgi:hypothetical protein
MAVGEFRHRMAVAALIQIKWAQTGKLAWQTDRHDTGSGPGRFGVGQRYCASLSRFAAGFLAGRGLGRLRCRLQRLRLACHGDLVDRKPGGQDKPLADAVALLREQLEAAEARAEAAEARAEGERARADALRDRLDVAQAELRQAADQARQEAQDAAEALLQAEAARKARGLVARLRAAWRGE